MKIDKDNWKDIDVNIDSLWIIGPRATGGKRTNFYHGNFVPQVPDNLIRRYTEEGDTVLDMFMGSGTTLYECENLNRNFIGFDINQEVIEYVENAMSGTTGIKFSIYNCDVTDTKAVDECVSSYFSDTKKKKVDFIISHPPYLDIIKFTNDPRDLSNISNIQTFINVYVKSIQNVVSHLRSKKKFAVIIGDIYRNEEVIPLGFYLMYAIRKNIDCKLKGIVIKDIVGNRAKIGKEALWRYRTLKSDNFLFKHEYIFVFKKN